MKTLNLNLLLLVAVLFAFSSCNKDNEDQPRPSSSDNIVGTWDVMTADATAYIDGVAYHDIEVVTDGTLKFDENGTGEADFTMTFLDDTDELVGAFNWERDGFELVISVNGEEAIRYVNVTNQIDYQELQVTYEDPDSNDEVEFTFKLNRLK